MAIKSSGTLSLRFDIAAEINGATSNISLRNLSSIVGFSTPDAMSEFYGYGVPPPPPPPPPVPPPPPPPSCIFTTYNGTFVVSWYPPSNDSQAIGNQTTYGDNCQGIDLWPYSPAGDYYAPPFDHEINAFGPNLYIKFFMDADKGDQGTMSYFITPPGGYSFVNISLFSNSIIWSSYDHNSSYFFASGTPNGIEGGLYKFMYSFIFYGIS